MALSASSSSSSRGPGVVASSTGSSTPSPELVQWAKAQIQGLFGNDMPVDSETVKTVLSKPAQEQQSFLTDFGADATAVYTFCQNLTHKRFELEVMAEQATKQTEDRLEAHFPKIKGMTARQKHQHAVKAEQERKSNMRKEKLGGGTTFFCSGQQEAGSSSSTAPALAYRKKEEEKPRRLCLCQGMRHGVLSNCLACGKINCKEEGYGPCLFCGNELNFDGIEGLAYGRADEEIENLQRAVERAKKLVQFDRESQKRTRVLDDAADWYSEAANPWLSQAQRKKAEAEGKKAEKREQAEKRKMHITFDFFGRTIVEAGSGVDYQQENRDKLEHFIEVETKAGKRDELTMDEIRGMSGSNVPQNLVGKSRELYDMMKKNLQNPRGMELGNKVNENRKGRSGAAVTTAASSSNPFLSEELREALKTQNPSAAGGATAKPGENEKEHKTRYGQTEFDDAFNLRAFVGGKENVDGNLFTANADADKAIKLGATTTMPVVGTAGAATGSSSSTAGPRQFPRDLDTEEQLLLEQQIAEASKKAGHASAGSSATNSRVQYDLFPAPKPLFADGLDEGKCLSLHQPWASLIIHGFKRAEGRPWNVDGKNKQFSRGRVWIHAAQKEPEEEAIKEVENYYRQLYSGYPQGGVPPLPSETGSGYPTSCILGCVDMLSIEDNATYKARRREELGLETEFAKITPQQTLDEQLMIEENNSEFIFWLESPRKLAVPCTMSGDHKFWDIPRGTLKTLQRALLPVRWPAQGLPQQFEQHYDYEFDLKTGALKSLNAGTTKLANSKDTADQKLYAQLLHSEQEEASKSSKKELVTLEKKQQFKQNDFTAFTRLADSFIHLHDLVPIAAQQEIIDFIAARAAAMSLPASEGGNGGGFFVEQLSSRGSSTSASRSGSFSKKPKICRLSLGTFALNFRKNKWEQGSAAQDISKSMLETWYRQAVRRANVNIEKVVDKFVPYSSVVSRAESVAESSSEDDDTPGREVDQEVGKGRRAAGASSSSNSKTKKTSPRTTGGGNKVSLTTNATTSPSSANIKPKLDALTGIPSSAPYFTPDVCWAEFHSKDAVVELRQEEIVDTADVPVVLINIGESVKISYTMGATPPSEGGRKLAVTVKSGDALVFGNKSRDLYHGVDEVLPNTRPPDLEMAKNGRLAGKKGGDNGKGKGKKAGKICGKQGNQGIKRGSGGSAPSSDPTAPPNAAQLTSYIKNAWTAESLFDIYAKYHKELDHIHLSACWNALGHLASKSHVDWREANTTKKNLPGMVEKTIEIVTSCEKIRVRQMANIAHGIAKSGCCSFSKAVLSLMSSLARAIEKNVPECQNTQELANIAWAFAKAGIADEKLLNAVAGASVDWLDHFNAQELSNFAWAFATANFHPMIPAANGGQDFFAKLAAASEAKLDGFASQGLTNTAWAFAKLASSSAPASGEGAKGTKAGLMNIDKLFKKIAEKAIAWMYDFNVLDIANVAWAFAKVGVFDKDLFASLGKATTAADAGFLVRGSVSGFSMQGLSTTAWSFAKAGHLDAELFAAIARAIVDASAGESASMNSQDVANVSWAFAKACHVDAKLFTLLADRTLEKLRSSSPAEGTGSSDFNAQDLVNIAWAFAKVGPQSCEDGSCKGKNQGQLFVDLFGRIASFLACRKREFLTELTASHLANVAWAFAQASKTAPQVAANSTTTDLFRALSKAAETKTPDFAASEIASIAWAFANANVCEGNLFGALAARAVELIDHIREEELDNCEWAFSTATSAAGAGLLSPSSLASCQKVVRLLRAKRKALGGGDGAAGDNVNGSGVDKDVAGAGGANANAEVQLQTKIPAKLAKKCGKIVIAGGGIGGNALAVALQRKGFTDIVVLEQDPSFDSRKQGYGLTVQRLDATSKLGVDLSHDDAPSTSHYTFDPSGKILGFYGEAFSAKFREESTNSGRFVHLPRQVLRKRIVEQIADPEKTIMWGSRLKNFEVFETNDAKTSAHASSKKKKQKSKSSSAPSSRVKVTLTDGRTLDAALLIGADGIFSSVRKQLSLPGDRLNYVGLVVVLGIVNEKADFAEAAGEPHAPAWTASSCDRPTSSCGTSTKNPAVPPLTYRRIFETVDGVTRIYVMPFTTTSTMWQLSFPITSEQEARELCKDSARLKTEIVARCKAWHDPVGFLLKATPLSEMSGYPVYDRELLQPSVLRGGGGSHQAVEGTNTLHRRVTLIGDAAHPMTPFRAQGANQALSDAVLLADTLAESLVKTAASSPRVSGEGTNVVDAAFDAFLPVFEEKMLSRSSRMVTGSREKAKELHSSLVLQPARKVQREAAIDMVSAIPLLREGGIGSWTAVEDKGLDVAVRDGDEVCRFLQLTSTTTIGDMKKLARLSKKAELLPAPRFMVCFLASNSSGDALSDSTTLADVLLLQMDDGGTPEETLPPAEVLRPLVSLHMGSRPMKVLFVLEGSDWKRRDVVGIMKALEEDGQGAKSLNSTQSLRTKCFRALRKSLVGSVLHGPEELREDGAPFGSYVTTEPLKSRPALEIAFFWFDESDEQGILRFTEEAAGYDVLILGECDRDDWDTRSGAVESEAFQSVLGCVNEILEEDQFAGGWIVFQGKAGDGIFDPVTGLTGGMLPFMGSVVPGQKKYNTYDATLKEAQKDAGFGGVFQAVEMGFPSLGRTRNHVGSPAMPIIRPSPNLFNRLFPGVVVSPSAVKKWNLYGNFNCWASDSIPKSAQLFRMASEYGAAAISWVGAVHEPLMPKSWRRNLLSDRGLFRDGDQEEDFIIQDLYARASPYTRLSFFSATANRPVSVAKQDAVRPKFDTPFAPFIAAHIMAAYREMEFEKVEEFLLKRYPIGSSVIIHGIQNQKELALNGRSGTVESKVDQTGRLGIRIPSGGGESEEDDTTVC
eukprot:g2397.t1